MLEAVKEKTIDEQISRGKIHVPLEEETKAAQYDKGVKLQFEIDEENESFEEEQQEFNERKRQHNETITQKEKMRDELLRQGRTGKAEIEDDFLLRIDWNANTATKLWPAKPAEGQKQIVVEERTLTADERQRGLFAQTDAVPETGQTLEE
jgi:hypothetical protein